MRRPRTAPLFVAVRTRLQTDYARTRTPSSSMLLLLLLPCRYLFIFFFQRYDRLGDVVRHALDEITSRRWRPRWRAARIVSHHTVFGVVVPETCTRWSSYISTRLEVAVHRLRAGPPRNFRPRRHNIYTASVRPNDFRSSQLHRVHAPATRSPRPHTTQERSRNRNPKCVTFFYDKAAERTENRSMRSISYTCDFKDGNRF